MHMIFRVKNVMHVIFRVKERFKIRHLILVPQVPLESDPPQAFGVSLDNAAEISSETPMNMNEGQLKCYLSFII